MKLTPLVLLWFCNTTDQRVFKQLDSGQKIIVQSSVNGETGNDKESQYVLFGGKKMDLLVGGKLADRFYGDRERINDNNWRHVA